MPEVSGSGLFDTLIVSLKESLEKVDFEIITTVITFIEIR